MNRQQRSIAQSMIEVVGTEQSWYALEAAVNEAKVRTRAWVDYFRANGANSATDVGKAAVSFACKVGRLSSGMADKSPTTLRKYADSGKLTDAQARTVRAIWSIETRARQLEKAEKAAVKIVNVDKTDIDVAPVVAPVVVADVAPVVAAPVAVDVADSMTDELPTVQTVPVQTVTVTREQLLQVIDLLNGDDVTQAIDRLNAMLA